MRLPRSNEVENEVNEVQNEVTLFKRGVLPRQRGVLNVVNRVGRAMPT